MFKLTPEEHFEIESPLNKANFTSLDPTKFAYLYMGQPAQKYFFKLLKKDAKHKCSPLIPNIVEYNMKYPLSSKTANRI